MKVTKDDIQYIEQGQTKVFDLTPAEMISARSYIRQRAMVLERTYKTQYDRKTRKFTVTRTV